MRPTAFVLAPAALLAATAVFAQAPQRTRQEPPAGDAPRAFTLPAPESFTLPNKLGVTLVPYGTVPKATVHLAVDVPMDRQTVGQLRPRPGGRGEYRTDQ